MTVYFNDNGKCKMLIGVLAVERKADRVVITTAFGKIIHIAHEQFISVYFKDREHIEREGF